MNYITSEKIVDSIITIQKARSDIEVIAEKLGYKKIIVPTVFSIRYKKWQKPVQAYLYWKNARIWNQTFERLEDSSSVILQVNFHNKCPIFHQVLKKHSKRLNFIVIIHDLESLLFASDQTKSAGYKQHTLKNELNTLKYAKIVISHNAAMTKKLIELGVDAQKIIDLEIFDYLPSHQKSGQKKGQKKTLDIHFGSDIIIAGNLGPEKSPYISKLHSIKGANFNLYGFNLNQSCLSDNVKYFGNFTPEELLKNLSGSFGLIWDGTDIKTCKGHTGNYLRYNNPHKTSLYLSAGLPVIIWQSAALADFVKFHQIGFTIQSLTELPEKLAQITPADYDRMRKNAKIIGKQLNSGFFTKAALEKSRARLPLIDN